MLDLDRLQSAYQQVRDELLAERTDDGHWVGELSSSALSTATAVSALAIVRRQGTGDRSQQASGGRQPPDGSVETYDSDFLNSLISRGIAYLATQQNDDGGFGDTDLSHSNIATTYLVVAAMHLARQVQGRGASEAGVPTQSVGTSEMEMLLAKANAYIETKGGLAGLRERYGIDKTFVVPIMTNLALAGLLDWREIDPLPFELACVPQAWYRFVGMPVVSYAIPALVAIGQARYHHAPPWNPVSRLIRWLSISRSLKVLRRMQPDSGGYLEATPLTAFVVMSLASIPKPRPVVAENGQTATNGRGFEGIADEVIHHGVKFLAASIRPDGSWPIDTNLATWNTTLAINALAGAGEDVAELLGPQCLDWLLSCQHTKRHPFTGADPGGFGWTDLSGAVPDADDTPGAILALNSWRESKRLNPELRFQIATTMCESGAWLFGLRNADGGWPTFCRGWGKLPFDRSGSDLTAHASRAFVELHNLMNEAEDGGDLDRWFFSRFDFNLYRRFNALAWRSRERYLQPRQHLDGSWSPLWFGNQDHPEEDNPVYGTAKVLFAYRDLGLMDSSEAQRGVAWLVANQNEDGGWGSGVWKKLQISNFRLQIGEECSASNLKSEIRNLKSSVEETALAVEALLAALPTSPQPLASSPLSAAVEKGLNWLLDRVERGEHRQPAPIGFYFAKLWYYERLYPLTFTVAALGRACRQFAHPAPLDSDAQPAPARVP